jgi:Putative Ig domain
MREFIRAGLAVFAGVAALAACGGGGGGSAADSSSGPPISGNYVLDGEAELLVAGSVRATLPAGVTGRLHCTLDQGSVPPGMAFGADCSLAGTPTAMGIYSSHVVLTVEGRSGAAGVDVTMRVGGPVLGTLFAPSREQRLLVPVSAPANGATIMADGLFTTQPGDAVIFEVVGGALPSGLAMDSTTGLITGAPLTLGTYTASIGAVLHRGGATYRMAPVSLPLDVLPPLGNALIYESAALCCDLVVSVGTVRSGAPRFLFPPEHLASVRFSLLGALPSGLQIDPDSGAVVGTATQPGRTPLAVRATVTTTEGAVYAIDSNGDAHHLIVTGVLPFYEFSSNGDHNYAAIGGGYPTYVQQTTLRNWPTNFDPGTPYGYKPGDLYTYALETDAQGNAPPPWVSIDVATGRVTALAPPELQVPRPAYRFALRVTTRRDGQSFSDVQTWDLGVR